MLNVSHKLYMGPFPLVVFRVKHVLPHFIVFKMQKPHEKTASGNGPYCSQDKNGKGNRRKISQINYIYIKLYRC